MIRAALIAILCLTACSKAPPPPKAPAQPVAAAMPADQAAFLALTKTGETATDFCTRFKTYNDIQNWQGTVHTLSVSSLDGTADLEINIGQSVRLETLVPKTDPNYPALLKLTYGQPISVSGQILHTNNDAECLYYRGPFGMRLSGLTAGRS